MPTTNPFIGRKEGIGLGIEGTPGTSVAPQIWMRWLDQDLQNKTDVIENESAMGVVEKINDSEVVARWAEGKIGGKVTAESVGFLLLGMFGSVTDGAAVSGVYPHTFAVNQSSVPTALTFAHSTPLSSQRHSYGVVDSFELTAEAGGWVEVSSAVKARVGTSSTETVAYTTEAEFTSKNVTVKLASNVAGLSGATALKAASVKLTIERDSEPFNPLGTSDTPEFDRGAFEAKGEIVLRYTDTQYETDYLANTIKALGIYIANGTTELNFTASRVRCRELEKSSDKDGVVTQTLSFYCEFDTTTGYAIQPVLKNGRAAYQAT